MTNTLNPSIADQQPAPLNTTVPFAFLRRIAPAMGVVVLAPLVGEYLLGNVPVSSLPWGLLFLAPMYGGGALLIREVTRRSGRGWETMLLLATAYGVLQPGLLDQGLFNPSYGGHDFQSLTPVPGAGFSAYWAQTFLVGHAIWSISIPIAMMEAIVPHRSTVPWLGKVGFSATTALFLFGTWIIFKDHQETYQFMASPPQLIGTIITVLALVGIAFTIGKASPPKSQNAVPPPWIVGVASFIVSSLFILRSEDWWGVGFGVGLLLVAAMVVSRWASSSKWSAMHRLALTGGTLLTYAWLGFLVAFFLGQMDAIQLVGNITLTLGAIVLIGVATNRVRKANLGEGMSTSFS
jgi:hypothetical protein